jgi:hypothetical protein
MYSIMYKPPPQSDKMNIPHFLMMLTVSGQMMWDVDLTKWEELNLVSLASAA